MKVKLICPWCGSTDIEPVVGIAGSVAVRCERCGLSTGYYDTAKEAVDELNNIAFANIGVNAQNSVQGKIWGQEAKRNATLCTGNGGQENGR